MKKKTNNKKKKRNKKKQKKKPKKNQQTNCVYWSCIPEWKLSSPSSSSPSMVVALQDQVKSLNCPCF